MYEKQNNKPLLKFKKKKKEKLDHDTEKSHLGCIT